MNLHRFIPLIILFTLLAAGCGVKASKTNLEKISDKFEVQLKGKVKPSQILGAYQKYKLDLIEPIDQSNNLWLFTYDKSLLEPAEMLKILKNSQFASAAKYHFPNDN